jgi:undecaprenyl pyrophosphate synthase
MITQKAIIEVLKTGNGPVPSTDLFLINKEFGQLNRSKNYTWMFQKTENYWTDANWRVVARDVQQCIKNYKSRTR